MQNQKFESLKCIPIYNDENHSLHIIIHIHMYICIYIYTYAYHHIWCNIIIYSHTSYIIYFIIIAPIIYIVIYTFLFAPTHLLYPLCRYDMVSTIYIFKFLYIGRLVPENISKYRHSTWFCLRGAAGHVTAETHYRFHISAAYHHSCICMRTHMQMHPTHHWMKLTR